MPSVFRFGSFVFFFWSGEDGEPVHIHVAVKRPRPDATKFWLTADGGAMIAHDDGTLSPKEMKRARQLVVANHAYIVQRWVEHFGTDSVRFYQ